MIKVQSPASCGAPTHELLSFDFIILHEAWFKELTGKPKQTKHGLAEPKSQLLAILLLGIFHTAPCRDYIETSYQEIASRLCVSKNDVRDAMKLLSERSLITVRFSVDNKTMTVYSNLINSRMNQLNQK